MELCTEYSRERLQVRARALSQNYRAEVEWSTSACTDGERIYLPLMSAHPHLDSLSDVEKLVSLHALGIHEAAHLRYSSFKVLKRLSSWPEEERALGKHVLNILEDARVEILVANSHPGTREYLLFFNDLALEGWLPEMGDIKAPGEQFIQALAQRTISGRIKGTPLEEVNDLLEEVEPLVHGARRSTSPWKPYRAAEIIVQKVKERWGIPKPPEPLSFRVGLFDGSNNTPKDAEKNAKDDLLGRKIEELHGGKGGESEDEEKGSSAGGSPDPSGRLGEALPMPEDLAERVMAELKRAEKEADARRRETSLEGTPLEEAVKTGAVSCDFVETGDRSEYRGICSEVSSVRKRLASNLKELLAAKTRTTRGLRKGRLDPTRIHRVALGRTDVYFRKRSKGSESVGFLLLVDESGSMATKDRYLHARKAAVLFSEVLRELKISHMVMGFTADKDGSSTDHMIYRTFSEKPSRQSPSMAGISAKLNNRDGASIRVATEYLARQRFRKKVLLVISDGEPYARLYSPPGSVRDTAMAVKEARLRGIKTIGISIDPDAENYLHEIYPSRVVVKRLEELPSKLLKVARRELS